MRKDEPRQHDLDVLRRGLEFPDEHPDAPPMDRVLRQARRQRMRRHAAWAAAACIVAAGGLWVATGTTPASTVPPQPIAEAPAEKTAAPVTVAEAPEPTPEPGSPAVFRYKNGFVAPSEETAAILLAAARHWESLDATKARQRYQEIVDRFPRSRAAGSARHILDQLRSHEPNEETA